MNRRMLVKDMPSGSRLVIEPFSGFWAFAPDEKAIRDASARYEEAKWDLERFRILEQNRVALVHAELHLTEQCNMRCKYCYVPKRLRGQTAKMTVADACRVVERVLEYADRKHLRRVTVTFHGGEPLLCRDEILAIVDAFGGEQRLEYAVQSNGTLLDEAFCEELCKRRIRLGLSLDGPAEANDPARVLPGGSSYEKVRQAAEIVKRWSGGGCGFLASIHSYNVDMLPDLVSFFHEAGAHAIFLNPIVPSTPEGAAVRPDTQLLLRRYQQAIQRQIDINRRNAPGRGIYIQNVEAQMLNIVADFQPCSCYESPCGAARFMLIVDCEGNAYPCSQFISDPSFALGNLLHHSVETVLASEFARLLRMRTVDGMECCKDCWVRYVCGGNCAFASYTRSGDFFQRPEYCELHRGIGEYLFQLLDAHGEELVGWLVSDHPGMRSGERYYEVG
jgi:uncharacterized protein